MTGQWIDLGLTSYRQAHNLQQHLVQLRRHELRQDIFLLLEHTPVYTLGRRGNRENLCVSEEFLHKHSIDLVHIERGGDITYHGPGQLVIYPIISLKEHRLAVKEYVWKLEEVMLQTTADFGVSACRDQRNHGIWAGDAKMGSIGIAIRHGVSFHGLALNVNTDLSPFSWINPCGLYNTPMTSMAKESGAPLDMAEVKESLRNNFTEALNMELCTVSAKTLDTFLRNSKQ
ncbi:lipoyl(octanoyl) transferase LipB [Desulfogranum japonicum]|uniref:lipoyl(octanoyl) transferase LipB n=1 Tax=Desulfogranum japonicum TaxID=231447 RepID=UPI0003F9642A|nr:lipoyl(octanoyl) transferase LipB [Desulfogranum japonicum]